MKARDLIAALQRLGEDREVELGIVNPQLQLARGTARRAVEFLPVWELAPRGTRKVVILGLGREERPSGVE